MDKIAVLIPCYNEAQSVVKVVSDFQKVLPEATIYVYDNNSTDGTAELAKEAGAVVRYEYQQGKGNVVRRMFREIEAESYIMVDGDDTYPAEYAPQMIDLVLNRQCDMVVGDRLSSTYFEENKRPFHNFGNVLVRRLINTLFKSNIRDIMTGYRAFSYRFVKTFPVLSKGFEIETEMSIHSLINNMAIENVIINYRDRAEGSESKLDTYSDGIKVLKTIFRMFRIYKPRFFYSLVTCLLKIISLCFIIPGLSGLVRSGTMTRLPILFIGTVILITGIVAFFSGEILESIQYRNRQEYELALISADRRFNDLKDKE